MAVRRRPAAGHLRDAEGVGVHPWPLTLEEEECRRMGVVHADRARGEGAVRLDPTAGPGDLVDGAAVRALRELVQHLDRLRRVEGGLLAVAERSSTPSILKKGQYSQSKLRVRRPVFSPFAIVRACDMISSKL